jgi:hypothetical protein
LFAVVEQFTELKGSRHYSPWGNSHALRYSRKTGDDMTKPPDREVLLEFQRVGSYMKATAMDAATLTEVSVVGPLNHSQEMLRRTVLAKLNYVLAKKAGTPPRA